MNITKEEFSKFFESIKLKYNVEFKIKLGLLKCLNSISDRNGFYFLLMNLCKDFKRKYEVKLIRPKSGISTEVTEELTGIPKEKIIYIKENYEELFNKFSEQ